MWNYELSCRFAIVPCCPVAMLFVPRKDGISHSKDEWTDFADIARGADVLSDALMKLANE